MWINIQFCFFASVFFLSVSPLFPEEPQPSVVGVGWNRGWPLEVVEALTPTCKHHSCNCQAPGTAGQTTSPAPVKYFLYQDNPGEQGGNQDTAGFSHRISSERAHFLLLLSPDSGFDCVSPNYCSFNKEKKSVLSNKPRHM